MKRKQKVGSNQEFGLLKIIDKIFAITISYLKLCTNIKISKMNEN